MRTFVRILTCLSTLAALSIQAATVSGTITFVTRRGQRPNVAETLVSLEPLDGRTPRVASAAATMTTRSKAFIPHVLAVPAGSSISFPNEDPISHNLFSLTPGNSFDLGLYRRGAGKTQKFAAPGIVNVYCNVHPNMSAVIHVMATPYYGFADGGGNYSLEVPPGRYRLTAWNEQGGTTSSEITVSPGAVTGNRSLKIDGRNHRDQPHTNKDGKAYRPPVNREY